MTDGYALRAPLFLTHRSFGASLLREAPSEDRKRGIDFHVRSDDYFGTLATVLGLIADSLQGSAGAPKKNLIDLRDELAYLQTFYRIERKD